MDSTTTLDEIVAFAQRQGKPVDRRSAAFTIGYITGKAFGKALKIGKGKTVCVTGASGFIASHCVQQLLATGYTVHGTVRSLENREKVAHLESLPFAATRLKLFEADLLVDGSFDAAVAGCDAVLHTASPFSTDSSLTEEDFCRPAVEGTLNVLNSLKRAGVKICVLTSSTAAVYCYTQGAGPDHVYSDSDWSDARALKENKVWYCLSKTLAEQKAHDFARANGIILKACNPTYVLGPRLQAGVNESTTGVLKYLDGTHKLIATGSKCIVDVRDVARAHILCYQKILADGPESFGDRVVLIAACPKWTEIVAQIAVSVPAELSDKVQIPSEVAKPGPPRAIPDHINFDCANARAIGLEFTPWEDTITATVESIAARWE